MARLYPANNFVPPKMGTGKRLVVGEAPGELESQLLEPFVGSSGEVFNGLCAKAGIARSELTILNTIQCRPPGNVYPTSAEARSYISREDADKAVSQCYERHLKPVLAGTRWNRVDLLGDQALRVVTGQSGISKRRGSILAAKDFPGLKCVGTLHPSYLMRQQELMPAVLSDLKKTLVEPPEHYSLYPSVDEVRALKARTLTLDLECNRFTQAISVVGVTDKPYHAWVIPFKGPYIPEIKRLLLEAIDLVGHNLLQFDLPLLCKNLDLDFQKLPGRVWDTMVMHSMLQTEMPHGLDFVASVFTNKPYWKDQAGDSPELYNARDVDATAQIYPQLKALLKQFDLMDLYQQEVVPLSRICHQMHKLGVKVDVSRINEVRERLKAQSQELETALPASLRTQQRPIRKRIPAPPGSKNKSGKTIRFQLVDSSESVTPWRSDKSVGEFLYGELGLAIQTHIKTGKQTTDKGALDKLYRQTRNPAIDAIRRLRSIDETLTTFAKEKMEFGTSIHSNFNVHVTATGRLSSSEPNLQNIPEAVRCIYVPHHAGWKLIQADFSSIENRLMAWMSRDQERLERLAQPGFNEHKWVASQCFGIPYEEVEKSADPESPYNKAKHVNHGFGYGLGPRKMSLMYGIPEKEVKGLILKLRGAMPKLAQFQEFITRQAKDQGYLANPFKRRRFFYTQSAYTESLAFPAQSTAADIIFRTMIGLMHERINWTFEETLKVCPRPIPLPQPAQLLLQVHDSLIFECPGTQLDEVVQVIQTVMTQPWPELGGFSCPIAIEVGTDWGPSSKGGTLESYVR